MSRRRLVLEPGERLETRGVLAGAYLASDDRRVYLTHTIRIPAAAERRADVVPLCGKVKPDNIADEYSQDPGEDAAPPTCPVCRRRDPRFPPP